MGSIFSHFGLIWELVKRDFTGRYKGSFVGVAWPLFPKDEVFPLEELPWAAEILAFLQFMVSQWIHLAAQIIFGKNTQGKSLISAELFA